MQFELNARARKILYAAVTEFIATGEPVASRTLSKKYALDLSAASIRNVLKDLEDAGFFHQPHTSSGRVPSEKAFRLFIDALMQVREIGDPQRAAIESRFSSLGHEGPGVDVARETARLLAGLTGTAAVVVAPRMDALSLQQIRFIQTRPGELLAVLVTSSGNVENRFFRAELTLSNEELTRIHNLLDDVLEGRTLRDVRELFVRRLQDAKNELGELRRRAFTLGQAALDAPAARGSSLIGSEVIIEGQAQLFDKPEFADVERIKQLARLLDEREQLVAMLDKTMDSRGIRIVLGSERANREGRDDRDDGRDSDDRGGALDQLSLVSASYVLTGAGKGSVAGSVSVLGPTRMDYPSIVPIVNETARKMGEFLARNQAEERDDS